jgi:hypothetical protein
LRAAAEIKDAGTFSFASDTIGFAELEDLFDGYTAHKR